MLYIPIQTISLPSVPRTRTELALDRGTIYLPPHEFFSGCTAVAIPLEVDILFTPPHLRIFVFFLHRYKCLGYARAK